MPTYTTNFNLAKPLVNNATDESLWGGYLNTDLDSIDNIMFYLAPVGVVLPYAGTAAPSANWLLCYGQAISRTTYATLFGVISTTYGSGDGSTTFNLPDLRGRSVFGKDDMGGSAANRVTNAVSGITGTTLGSAGGNEALTAHTHTGTTDNRSLTGSFNGAGNATRFSAATGIFAGSNTTTLDNGTGAGSAFATMSIDASHTHTFTTASTGAGASQNMPPALIINWIIRV